MSLFARRFRMIVFVEGISRRIHPGVRKNLTANSIIRLLRSYNDVRLTLYPVIADFDGFQKNVNTFLENRALQGLCANNHMAPSVAPYGFSISFIGILFAILASGCQVSDFSRKERTSMCQLYGRLCKYLGLSCYDKIANNVSIVCISMSSEWQLSIAAKHGGHPDLVDYWRCSFV